MLIIAQIGDPILKQAVETVTQFNEELVELADRMLEAMNFNKGVGIAAPQVSEPLAMFILASAPNERYPNAPTMAPLVIVNPKIEMVSDEMEAGSEGCLSIPRRKLSIMRHTWVQASYQDLQGHWHQQKFSGFIARIFQHEFDHLQGITLMERVKMAAEES